MTSLAALAAILGGGGFTIAYVGLVLGGALAPVPVLGLTPGLAPAASGIVGAAIGFAAAVIVSLITPAPGIGRLAVVDAIRRPSPDPILEDHAT